MLFKGESGFVELDDLGGGRSVDERGGDECVDGAVGPLDVEHDLGAEKFGAKDLLNVRQLCVVGGEDARGKRICKVGALAVGVHLGEHVLIEHPNLQGLRKLGALELKQVLNLSLNEALMKHLFNHKMVVGDLREQRDGGSNTGAVSGGGSGKGDLERVSQGTGDSRDGGEGRRAGEGRGVEDRSGGRGEGIKLTIGGSRVHN